MKGIAHFVSGVAAASFFPWSIEAALRGNPVYFVLGGACALLPDTIDFKFYRFFFRHDVYLDPDPVRPDTAAMAAALAGAAGRARREGCRVRVKLNTIRRGADYWQQYRVRFDPVGSRVQVRLGPVVNTGQVPVPGTEPGAAEAAGEAPLPCPVVQTYDAVTTVDIFDGPTFEFEPRPDGCVVLHFLPWHRKWSHSLTVGLALALLAWPLYTWRASIVMVLGFALHVAEDQLGFMGSNLFFPLTRRRVSGLRWMRSGDAVPNFLAVWVGCLLVFWNLYRASPGPLPAIRPAAFFLGGGLLPLAAFGLLHRLLRRPTGRDGPVDTSQEWGDSMIT